MVEESYFVGFIDYPSRKMWLDATRKIKVRAWFGLDQGC